MKRLSVLPRTLNKTFVMKDMGIPKVFLEINIDVFKNSFNLFMKDTIGRVAETFDIMETQQNIETSVVKGFD